MKNVIRGGISGGARGERNKIFVNASFSTFPLWNDTHDPRRGFVGYFANSPGAAARACRPRRSAYRVARAPQKSTTSPQFLDIDRVDLCRGCAGTAEIGKKQLSFLTPTTPIPAEGGAGILKFAKHPQFFLNIGHANLRRGCHFRRVGSVPPKTILNVACELLRALCLCMFPVRIPMPFAMRFSVQFPCPIPYAFRYAFL